MKHSTYLLRAVAAMVAVSTVFGAQASTGLNATVYSDWERGGVARGSTGDITFAGLTPVGSFLDPAIDHWDDTNFYLWNPLGQSDYYSVRWTGYLTGGSTGLYDFRVTADDGVQVIIGGATVIDSPELQWFGVSTGSMALDGSPVSIEVRYYEDRYWDGIRLEWKKPDSSWEVIPTAALAPVPEPETYALLLAGLGVLGWVGRQRKVN